MKLNVYILLIIVAVSSTMQSCKKYMDMGHYFKDRMSIDTVFVRRDYSEQWLADTYTHLRGENVDVASKDNAPFNLISDDMFFGDRGDELDNRSYKNYKNGEYTESWIQGSWASCYQGIRKATIFIYNIDRNREFSATEISERKAEARFLRAYYYWLLIRKYGPVPMAPEQGVDYTLPYEELSIPRAKYDDLVDYITKELALAAVDLPQTHTNREQGRATRGAALAARAKVYLYAASPEFNGNTEFADVVDNQGNKLVSQTYNEEKWARAAAAAKDVIDMGLYKLFTVPFNAVDQGPAQPKTIVPPFNARYSNASFPAGWADIDPFESYRQLFNGALNASGNPELIFSRVTETGTIGPVSMALHQTPYSMGGWNAHGITQKQCDAYYMNDGGDVPLNPRVSGYTDNAVDHLPLPAGVSLQYANREPRFYASVAYSGSIWYRLSALDPALRSKQVFYYRGEADGKQPASPQFHVRTGLGVKKYINPTDSHDSKVLGSFVVPKVEPAIRYAEILLIYAEAMNELSGSYTIPDYTGKASHTISRDVTEMSKSVSQIRIRGGVPDYDPGVYNAQEQLRKALKRERQIELLGENHRYYDLRRWKDAPVEEAMPIYGCNMDMTASQRDIFYTPVIIPSFPTIFVKKMYLWPISHDEMRKNTKLTQNPGWTAPY
ncbi:MAG: RagB/SusD family nutrient uptake outer membrane protein [Candidatus Pseudobacter hemicellulosilyticus]|uniref:RagB/SusD family nutrient uptake outer membrane protein n=1 Tax=Candidatus Pseudobacter hemicellulosilyticus TaxID=3121375 RepID=A0AAJ6BEM8_9BACT|nr:MAG: RagB/SusD family nutrient uptake outer membrane protein [Pseudobacter sp.]